MIQPDKQNTKADDGDRPALLEIRGLKKHFPVRRGFFRRTTGQIRAVDDVSLTIYEGEALGLVGESGCGKTTLGRCVLRVIDATGGEVLFRTGGDQRAVDLVGMNQKALRPLRRHIQMIFQDPFSSLDPRMTVLDIVGEPLVENGLARGKDVTDKVKSLMEDVGLDVKHLRRYPHAFSGGQRQRIGIARALAPEPKLIVCDEPVSALDVSVQAQILNLLQDLQRARGLTYLFISHDLAVVQHVCDRVAVMYVGQIVELAEAASLFERPRHPYTAALLRAVLKPDPDLAEEPAEMAGEVADPANPPPGCYFHPRCPHAQPICRTDRPAWDEVAPGRFAACHFARELDLEGA